MPRDIPVGNDSMLVMYDKKGIARDIYFPFVGKENHAQGHPFRVGVWARGVFSWLDDGGWERSLDYEDDTLVAAMRFANRRLGLELLVRDVVDFHENIYVREITAVNLAGEDLEARLFFAQDFRIYGTDIGDTASYKPEERAILHYKGKRYFLVNAMAGGTAGFAQYAAGFKEAKGLEGTWRDAEDGVLSGNPVAQGSVDSVGAVHLSVPAGGRSTAYYWMSVCEDWRGVKRLEDLVAARSPGHFIKRTADYWRLWVNKRPLDFDGLPEDLVRLYKRSLLVLRTAVNDNGAVVASCDSDIQHYYRDTYCYFWPRDGAIAAFGLDLAGYAMLARRFFDFCGRIVGRNGFFFQKYNPDGTLASSWHPWVLDGKPHLPIQEDETGLVLWAFWKHFQRHRDIEFVKPHYRKLVKAAADFMCAFTDPATGLPLPSYDLWEERLGVHAFTVSSVIAGLRAAAGFTAAFGEEEVSARYKAAAEGMKEALLAHLYDAERGRFLTSLLGGPGKPLQRDYRLDSSLFGLFALEVLPAADEKVASTMAQLKEALWCQGPVGGMARYENDRYQAAVTPSKKAPGNPWVISTLWYARYLIERARDEGGLKEALPLMQWAARTALPSGVLAEQIHPFTGEPLSVSPLTWSHAEYVITVQQYLNKLQDLKRCPECGHPTYMKHPA
ncbi:MAG: glycoside hydrolase family 15 protein [Thermodesulfovibrionales bacterium]